MTIRIVPTVPSVPGRLRKPCSMKRKKDNLTRTGGDRTISIKTMESCAMIGKDNNLDELTLYCVGSFFFIWILKVYSAAGKI